MKDIIKEIQYIFNNCFVKGIPFWPIRRFLYKLQGMKIGKGSRILMGTRIVTPSRISIGNHSYINECCFLDGRGGITIGSNVTIAVFSKLITGSHNIDDDDFSFRSESITIGDNVVVFANTMLLGGVTIEKGCVFSACSLVRKGQYRTGGLYAGNPAEYIKQRKSNCNYIQDTWHPLFR